ncbi:hypothetical protein ACQKDD_05330 [Planococcus kocurii]|uniref:Lipoprotein n=1 Tax=Planococcus kocurii TaxID=1374 RepID=A0ABM5WT41_9BACL|nr:MULTISPECIES: hypothetical protein [Planococcus]ALS77491.1 hypothetical protein AUO94_02020 [Planococcus kocurii]KAA0959127.1 hypothetical protein FQ085_05240 [Planococcus sp. ANT_H30]
MKKVLCTVILLGAVTLASCSGLSTHEDDEVAAIVNNHEITIGDLRFLYPDDSALDYLDSAIAVELIKQEVQEMNLDISPHLTGETTSEEFEKLPPANTKDEGGKQVRAYAIAQAEKLDMSPEEFQKQYGKKINEQNAYINTYLEEKLGGGNVNDLTWMDDFGEDYNRLVEKLVEKNKNDIDVFIN